MDNIVILSLEKLENIKNISDLGIKTLSLQNLSYFLIKNQNKLKIELHYPLFWNNLENLISQSLFHRNSYDIDLNDQSTKIILNNKATFLSYESDLISPQDLVAYLTTEAIQPQERLLLEVLCSNASVYLSLNLILNLPE